MHIPNIHEVQCKWTMYNISIELWRHYLITTFFLCLSFARMIKVRRTMQGPQNMIHL